MSGGRLPPLPVTDNRNYYLDTLDYGNGDSIQYEYDKMGRVTKQTYEDGETVSCQYDNNGALATVTDSETGIKTTYYYDFTDRMMKYVESGDGYTHSVGYEYDQLNNLTTLVETINGTDRTTSYRYDEDNRLISEEVDNMEILYEYDGFGRVSTQTIKEGETVKQTNTYGYAVGSAENTTSTQVTSYNGYIYTYDDNGNILSVNDGTYTTSYVYDSQNQLLRENNQAKNFTKVWTYDNAGNIQSRTEYAYTTGTPGTPTDTVNYAYENSDWGDLLTSYDGKTFTYDGVGNLLSDGEWTYIWKHGRQLESMSQTSANGFSTTWTYTYDANGMRTSRVCNNGYTYEYIYNGSQLSSMIINGTVYRFTYDANGVPLTMIWGSEIYYYVTNLQGDVIGIKNSNGVQVTTYTYDAWGKMYASSTSPVIMYNPLTYRGYVYDRETGLYYLQSRYYDPEIGRFINADAFVSTGQGFVGNNMFAYCLNNPVNMADYDGCNPGYLLVVGEYVALIVVAIYTVSIIFSPDFQQSVTASISKIVDYFSSGIEIIEKFAVAMPYDQNIAISTSGKSSALEVIEKQAKKPVNLPSWKKLTVDMSHIKTGHMAGGPRNPKGNKSVFWGLTTNQILHAIKEAYNNSTKIYTQFERVLITGYSSTYKLVIEMWVNLKDFVIETAYPK